MPRRRASKGKSPANRGKGGGSIRRWNNREDIPLDEVDQFHEQRDRILLEGDEAVPDSDFDDDEVFTLKGLAESSEEEADEDNIEDEENEDMEQPAQGKKGKKKEKKVSGRAVRKHLESSEEESDDEEEEESWGLKKSAYYSSNAAHLEPNDEEAHEMEEQEARRLQAKLRESMREEDFGYSEALQSMVDLKDVDDLWKPIEKPVSVSVGTDKASILRHLEKTSPETLALAYEWEDVALSVMKSERKLSGMTDDKEDRTLGLIHLHHQTQLTYAALLAFYLHLRSSERYSTQPGLLRQHPIFKRLLTLKQSLTTLEDLNFDMSDSEDDLDSEDFDEEDESDSDSLIDELGTQLATRKRGLDVGELEDLLSGSSIPVNEKPRSKAQANPDIEQQPKKKQKSSSGKALPKFTFDVEEPVIPKAGSSSISTKKNNSTHAFGFGEATTLDDTDVADKSGRRKALRFHTAKIESASARRLGARNALGGDDDVPYRDRRKQGERQKRSSLGTGGADLDDAEPESREQPQKRGRDVNSDEGSSTEDEDDGYYSLIKKQKKAKKAERKAQYDTAKEANRLDFNNESAAGQRAITRAILANKGLTPKRGKSVRNPRVKKRQKFEKAKKKLSSQKAIYKGGIGDTGHYDGEKSGISKVVKSVKL